MLPSNRRVGRVKRGWKGGKERVQSRYRNVQSVYRKCKDVYRKSIEDVQEGCRRGAREDTEWVQRGYMGYIGSKNGVEKGHRGVQGCREYKGVQNRYWKKTVEIHRGVQSR